MDGLMKFVSTTATSVLSVYLLVHSRKSAGRGILYTGGHERARGKRGSGESLVSVHFLYSLWASSRRKASFGFAWTTDGWTSLQQKTTSGYLELTTPCIRFLGQCNSRPWIWNAATGRLLCSPETKTWHSLRDRAYEVHIYAFWILRRSSDVRKRDRIRSTGSQLRSLLGVPGRWDSCRTYFPRVASEGPISYWTARISTVPEGGAVHTVSPERVTTGSEYLKAIWSANREGQTRVEKLPVYLIPQLHSRIHRHLKAGPTTQAGGANFPLLSRSLICLPVPEGDIVYEACPSTRGPNLREVD
jgi:hypothetical protein